MQELNIKVSRRKGIAKISAITNAIDTKRLMKQRTSSSKIQTF
jgi:hypothetical protein